MCIRDRTTSQRQQVEGYLAHKWGLLPPSSITPLTIPGCQLWLDVTDSSTTVSSGSVTSITNKCTNTAATLSSTLPTYNSSLINGLPGINFTGSSFIRGNFSSAYTGSNLIVFAVGSLSSTITTAYARLVSFSVPGSLDYNSVERVGAILRQLQIQGISSYRNGGEIGSGTGIAYNTNYLFCTEFTGTTYNFYLNGSKTSTASSSGSFNISAWGVGYLADYGGSDDAAYWKGSFGECITYLGSLTTAQRQTIENYLLNKWGISNTSSSLISTHPFKSIMPATSAHFSPTSISGCQLWLDADDALNFTGSTWNDKSGTNNHAVNGTPGTSSMPTVTTWSNGRRAARFVKESKNSMKTTNSIPIYVTYFIVARVQDVIGATGFGLLMVNNFDGQRQLRTNSTSFPVSVFYFTQTGGTNMVLGSFSQGQGFLFSGTVTSGSAIGYSNGVQIGTSGVNNSTPSRHYFGSGDGDTAYVSVDFAEILIYDSVLTTSERQQVEGYLAHKWGLSLYLPVISPLTIPGCQLWFDAADTSSMTFSGSTITQWNDKSGNGRNATIASGRIGAVYSTALNAVNFATSNTGYITNYSASPTNETVFVVFNNSSPTNYNFILIGGVSGARSLAAGFTNTGSGTVGNLNTQVAWLVSTGGYTLGTTALVTSQFTTSTNSISLNGGTAATGGAPGFTAGRVTYLGVDATNPIFYYVGYAMEILFYNSILTTSQRQQVEGYLAKKWGISISATLPSPHSFKSFPPASLPFSPRNISGLQLWLDAADQSSMTLSGSNVTQWSDKSGNGYVMTNNGGTTTIATASLNSLTTVYTPSGTNTRITNFVGRTKCTIFLVGKAASSRYLLALNGGFLYTANDSLLYFSPPTGDYLDLVDSVSGSIVSNNTWFILCIGYDNATNSTANPYTINGTTRSTTITPRGTPGILTDQNITSTLYINSINGTNSYDSVYTAEILYYNDTLTTSQRQQIEGYLAQKWGLIGLLPSSHPFKKLPA